MNDARQDEARVKDSGATIHQVAPAVTLIALVTAVFIAINADWDAPPRFDGAGYAILARSLRQGTGYRAIDHPNSPEHNHFPPGYPAALALVWSAVGESAISARLFSAACTVVAAIAAYFWFRRIDPLPDPNHKPIAAWSRSSVWLGLALAVNWNWARTGSGIQSEPLFMAIGQIILLIATTSPEKGTCGRAVFLGGLLAAATLTRHVGIGLVGALLLNMKLDRKWRNAAVVLTTFLVLVLPWLLWLRSIGSSEAGPTQTALHLQDAQGIGSRLARLAGFYIQRIPDQIVGPFVEVATVFQSSPAVAFLANLWAILATSIVVLGWIQLLRFPSSRLGGLVPLVSLTILLAWPFTEAGRFLIPLIPFVLLGFAKGLSRVFQVLAMVLRPSRMTALTLIDSQWVAAILILALSLPYSIYVGLSGKARSRDAGDRGFDRACAWLVANATQPGPVLTRHPGEVFWQTGRQALDVSSSERPGTSDASADEIAAVIRRYRVAYLLIDEQRYANALPSPLSAFVQSRPGWTREVWSLTDAGETLSIHEVRAP
jgi:hypothetical protein